MLTRIGWSCDQILWNSKAFLEDFIMYQPRSYPDELFNIAVYYVHVNNLRLRKSKLFKIINKIVLSCMFMEIQLSNNKLGRLSV